MKLRSGFVAFDIDGDLSPLIDAVLRMFHEQWDEWKYRQQAFYVHKATKTFPFIWSDNDDFSMKTVVHNQDTELWSLVEPFVRFLEDKYNGRATKAMLAKLPAHEGISEHVDGGALELVHRVHVPLITNDKVAFNVSGIDFNLRVGYAYELSNTEPHSVQNNSEIDRVHLMVDILPNSR